MSKSKQNCYCNHPSNYCDMSVKAIDFDLNNKNNWFKPTPAYSKDPVEFNLDHGNWLMNLNDRTQVNNDICRRFTDDSHITPPYFRAHNADLHHTMRNLDKPFNKHCALRTPMKNK
jgi:hypothetical protein